MSITLHVSKLNIPLYAVHRLVFGTEAEHSEHHHGGQNRREEVNNGDSVGIAVAVVVLGVVGGVRDDGPEAEAQGKEHLRGCPSPNLHICPDL